MRRNFMETSMIRYLGNTFSVLEKKTFGDRIEYYAEDMFGIRFYLSRHAGNENLFSEIEEDEPLGIHVFYSTSFSIDSLTLQIDQNPANRDKVLDFLVGLCIIERVENWAGIDYKIAKKSAISWDNYFSLSYVIHNIKLLRALYVSQFANR